MKKIALLLFFLVWIVSKGFALCLSSDTLLELKYLLNTKGHLLIAGQKVIKNNRFLIVTDLVNQVSPKQTLQLKIGNDFSAFREFSLLDKTHYFLRCTGILDSSKGYYAIVDSSLQIISQGNYDAKTLNKARQICSNSYDKIFTSNNECLVVVTDSFSFTKNKPTKQIGATLKIRSLSINTTVFPNNYQNTWETIIPNVKNVYQAKFINLEGQGILWLSGEDATGCFTGIFTFNLNTGDIIKQLRISSPIAHSLLLYSKHLALTTTKEIIVAGNYFDAARSWQQVRLWDSPSGWFAIKISIDGDTTRTIFSSKLISHPEVAVNGLDKQKRQTIIVRSIIENPGSIEIIGEGYSKRFDATGKVISKGFTLNALIHYFLNDKLTIQSSSLLTNVVHFQGMTIANNLNNDTRTLKFEDVLFNSNVKPFLFAFLPNEEGKNKSLFYSKAIPLKYFLSTSKVIDVSNPTSVPANGELIYATPTDSGNILMLWDLKTGYCIMEEQW